MKSKIKELLTAYKDLLGEIYREKPFMVIMTFLAAILLGLFTPLSVYVNSHIFNDGIAIARGEMTFGQYIPFLILFVLLTILPPIIGWVFIYGYVQPRSLLVLRTSMRGRMLQKIKKMKYEHFENEESMEIIDKAYNRVENAARHMFPMYVVTAISSLVASLGALWYLYSVKWWLLLTVLIPFILETYLTTKTNYNIYDELETYWQKERRYWILGSFLRSREYLRENKTFQAADYLIDTYRKRLNSRNREYEKYYFRHLKSNFTKYYITDLAIIFNVIILLVLFIKGELNIGLFISLSQLIFRDLFGDLMGSVWPIRWSGHHINFFNYFKKYLALAEDEDGELEEIPEKVSIEFKDVWFKYPGTERYVLKGLNLLINDQEKLSIVGENGEGKSTMVKLLLGLFTPDRGQILINGVPLFNYSARARSKIFGPIFQDFFRYSITVRENVAIGDIDYLADKEKLEQALRQARADEFVNELSDKEETLLGRDFDGGRDLSGGQWQRIAIARAFMGDKPVLILDEPTSQLDPVAESNLYSEFAEMAKNKTAIFITHRLASTMITDKIYVIAEGKVQESGTHEELMQAGGLYAQMFEAQKQWYQKGEVNAYVQ